METKNLPPELERALRRLLSEQNRDASTPTHGCFDRRYWSWKLVDFPEATFQRNVWPLAWWYRRLADGDMRRQLLLDAVRAALTYTCRIQHRNGAFDQAFPNEYSFGATAFLVDPLLAAYLVVRDAVSDGEQGATEDCLRRGADFLCRHDETHGHIANHLAGAVWSLVQCADLFGEPRYEVRAMELLDRILDRQSAEGWFLEYEGADPGYQTLCMHYLAQVATRRTLPTLNEALDRAVDFISWCIHPDGSFGGEYGSRRTPVFYPGGIALLAARLPLARSMSEFMAASAVAGTTVGLADVDMGNMAPLLTSTMLALDAWKVGAGETAVELPWEIKEARRDFPDAGFYMRGLGRHYAVLGASNGGVLKVFERETRRLVLDDAGYLGETRDSMRLTTQITERARPCRVLEDAVELDAQFHALKAPVPTPFQFLVLRALNLTVMRSIFIGNLIKILLVRLLISGRKTVPLHMVRRVEFTTVGISVRDRIESTGGPVLISLGCGRPFVAVHMASSRYYPGFAAVSYACHDVDVAALTATGAAELRFEVC
jgi:hypothetical protein